LGGGLKRLESPQVLLEVDIDQSEILEIVEAFPFYDLAHHLIKDFYWELIDVEILN
jgi:hypothetical protein